MSVVDLLASIGAIHFPQLYRFVTWFILRAPTRTGIFSAHYGHIGKGDLFAKATLLVQDEATSVCLDICFVKDKESAVLAKRSLRSV